MTLTSEQIKKFQEIYKKEFGEEINDQDALEGATKLVNLMRIIYKPITKEEYDKYSKKE